MPFYRRRPPLGPLVTCPATGHQADAPTRRPNQGEVPEPAGYAVVDLETTGLSPVRDQILEIGVVLTDPTGTPERSWTTLIRPETSQAGTIEVGPTEIHGLTPDDLVDAPRLGDVADLLVADLVGRVVVAHNARFDVGFLTQALGRTGHLRPGARIPRVCTMEWARHFLTTPSRRLATCCEVAGIPLEHHHCALDDAQAAAALLRHYLRVGAERGEELVWSRSLQDAALFAGWLWDDGAVAAQQVRLTSRPT